MTVPPRTDPRPPDSAMVLAAGLGTRMRPLTLTLPKALVPVAGKPLIDHTLDQLAMAGVERAVVNVHHFADQVEAHLTARTRPSIVISDERGQLLESGGGVVKALPLLGDAPFLVANADSFFIDGPRSNILRLAEVWDGAAMDVLLLVTPAATSVGYDGVGDYALDAVGRLRRRREREVVPFIYAGMSIMAPALFKDAPAGPFSLNRLFDAAEARGRLHGLRLDGLWLHVGTPQAIGEAERSISRSAA